jgi:TPR repeat protein
MVKRILLIFILSVVTLNANNFRNGMIAYKKANYSDAKAFFKAGVVDDKSVTASYMLGRMYLNGHGVEENTEQAVKLLLHAYDSGNIPAGCYLSEAYMKEGTNLALLAVGIIEGLRKRVPHCKVVLKQYHVYNFPTGFNFENTTNY